MNCARLNSLCGIGLMLVGALGYTLPQEQDPLTLLPAIGGIVMASAGLGVTERDRDPLTKLLLTNAVISFFLLLPYSVYKLCTEFISGRGGPHLTGDIAILLVAMAWLAAWQMRKLHQSRTAA